MSTQIDTNVSDGAMEPSAPFVFEATITTDIQEDYIAKIPAVDVVEVKHGYWVKNAPNPGAMRTLHKAGIAKAMRENSIYWTCSCCNEWGHPYDKYCSSCGAKMDGERRSE